MLALEARGDGNSKTVTKSDEAFALLLIGEGYCSNLTMTTMINQDGLSNTN
jgi:hypothetical protein